ncbi:hypothetical protein [Actinomadura sp. HBU206391]|uniref:hypothetical protein n=1 Tax=Actinomadura sp. HBU206391 TaxID=2731692 RepID=UPI00164FBD93|nr:hypothetical protein [Actinomadura sp. HBU206391]MBC6462431.1 hypothetical protein [Actinomadura sp. HBU206391]
MADSRGSDGGTDWGADKLDPTGVMDALTALRAPIAVDPAVALDSAFLLGRLLATVEVKAGAGGRHDDWRNFDAGYLSAIASPDRPQSQVLVHLGIKRLIRTVRQLREIDGMAAQAALMGLTAVVSALFVEALVADDETPLEDFFEPLEEARNLLAKATDKVAELQGTLKQFRAGP